MDRKKINQMVAERLPKHPKDEYSAARKMKRHFIVHYGDTNSGKTYASLQALKAARNGVYLGPLRLLALEVFADMNDAGFPCTLMTGEEEVVMPGAQYVSSTIEKLDLSRRYEAAVIDEAQMVADSQRGGAWTRAILGAQAKQIYVCCSPDAVSLICNMVADCGDKLTLVEHKRETPLYVENNVFRFPRDVNKYDALVVFSKKAAIRVANALAVEGIKSSILYGNLPPQTRREQIELFASGETDVVVCTDAIGMGVNLPIKRVVFLETTKYDGISRRPINMSEIRQIGGRAGRKGIFDCGYITSIDDRKKIKSSIYADSVPVLETAYVAPLEDFIINFPYGTLGERLAAWEAHKPAAYYKKADISEPLALLGIYNNTIEIFAQYCGKRALSLEEQFKAIFIPFDSKDNELVWLWEHYIKQKINDEELTFPPCKGYDLNDYEKYYRALDLYFSFGKTFNIPIDVSRVEKEKSATAETIHNILKDKIKEMQHKCRSCGKLLPWNHFYNMCDSCYYERFDCEW